jgi:hypothetical protein
MHELPRIDKEELSFGPLDDIEEEKSHWASRSAQERLAAVELNRRLVYGKDRVTSRLQRFLEISELA